MIFAKTFGKVRVVTHFWRHFHRGQGVAAAAAVARWNYLGNDAFGRERQILQKENIVQLDQLCE